MDRGVADDAPQTVPRHAPGKRGKLWPAHFQAIESLEKSFREDRHAQRLRFSDIKALADAIKARPGALRQRPSGEPTKPSTAPRSGCGGKPAFDRCRVARPVRPPP